MTPAANASLSLILVALGILGIILSFLVPERKKSVISLLLALVIVFVGLYQYRSHSVSSSRWKKRMQDIQKDRKVDLEELQKKLKAQAEETRKKLESSAPQN